MSRRSVKRQSRRPFLRPSTLRTAAVPATPVGAVIARSAGPDACDADGNLRGPIAVFRPVDGNDKPIPDAECERRRAKAQRGMAQHRIVAGFIAGGASLGYLVDVRRGVRERPAGMALARPGDPVCVTQVFEPSRAVQRPSVERAFG